MAINGKIIFAALFGVLYLIFGIAMITSAAIPSLAELTGVYLIPADPAGGFVLCVIGTVFLFACHKLVRGSVDGPAFLYTGMIMSLVFGAVALVSLGAQGIDILLFSEGEESWVPIQLVVPMLYLALVPIIGLITWGRAFLNDLAGA
ncbi:hypothetical protein [Methanosphaerula palustris]|uniref:Uncharacterized protein n=1 Tax=Methanosphaerula palustris (strain ATCC BAA-1556 / DSM 19958 / E1-9c) TaxID=521011 RepID=B8GEA8_METPE|nr:hypothetical protein [Methanosphaerula palustris]ACL17609.1 conserved hypothetical protein [Methanosphaerula palustris E1-9c]